MKIAYLAPEFLPPWGGVGIYCINLINEMSKQKGIEIHVITPKRGNEFDKKRIEQYFGNRIIVHQISKANDTFLYNFKFQIALFFKFRKLRKKYKFDLVHAANLVNMPDIFLVLLGHNIPHIVTVHTTIAKQLKGSVGSKSEMKKEASKKNIFGLANSEKASLLAYPIISFLEKLYLRKTRHMISVSEKYKTMLRNEYKFKGRIDVVNNGIDTSLFDYNKIKTSKSKELEELKDTGSKKRTKKKESKKASGPVVLFTGRLLKIKGISTLLDAARKVLSKNRNVHFVLCGRGDGKKLDTRKIPKKNISIVGFVDNDKLPEYYKLADIFVLPSYSENFPISLIEAMSMKCACIASNVGSVDEIITDNVDGLLIKPRDANTLAENILKLVNNEKLRDELGKKAQITVNKKFSSKVMADKTRKIYERVINDEV